MELKDFAEDYGEDTVFCIDVGIQGSLQKNNETEQPRYTRIGSCKSLYKNKNTIESVAKRLNSYNYNIENDLIVVWCDCDGTLAFLEEMILLLFFFGCSEIRCNSEETDRGTRFYAGGKMQTEFPV